MYLEMVNRRLTNRFGGAWPKRSRVTSNLSWPGRAPPMTRFSLRLDVELAREGRVGVLLIGQKVSELCTAEQVDEHSLTLEPVCDALGFDRVRYVLRELRQRFF